MIIRIDVCLTIFGLLFGLFSITSTVDVPQTASQLRRLATNSIRRAAPTSKDTVNIPVGFTAFVTNLKRVNYSYPNDINPSKQFAKPKQNTNNPLAAAGKPQATVTSFSNSDDRRKNVNTKTTSKTISTGNDNVHYPGPTHRTGKPEGLTRTAFPLTPSDNEIRNCVEEPTGGTLCNITENYPTQLVQNLLDSPDTTGRYGHLFGVDIIYNNSLESSGIHTRFQDDNVDYKSFCQSEEKIIFPTMGRNIRDEWKYIMQDPSGNDGKYSQGVRVETCRIDERKQALPCNIVNSVPNGYPPFCSQKYIVRKLVTVSKDREPEPDSIIMPSCCVCVYQQEVQLGARTDFASQDTNPRFAVKKALSPRNG